MKHIVFDSADDLIKFIMARRIGSGRRSLFCETIFFGDRDYRLNFERDEWDEAGDRFGGRIVEGTAKGRSMSVNELLEHVLLKRVRSDFNSGASSIVLALPVKGQEADASAQQILYDAWRQIGRAEWARSAFHLCKTLAGEGWHAVLVDGISTAFDFEVFRQANRPKFDHHKLRALAPAWNSSGCNLYVEWEYIYPKAAEFAQLHRESSAQLILCLAEREAQTGEARRAFWVPKWHVLHGEVYYTVSDLFEIAPPDSVEIKAYPSAASTDLPKLTLPLQIGPVAESVASARDLELRIGQLKRELEALTGKRERLDRAAHQEFFAIYRWRQDANQSALPVGLEHLLGKPLSELNRYLYLQTMDASGATLHFVANKDHQTSGLAAAVACDQCYLCDTRWLTWRLPLFVRQGQALKIDIDEEEMAAQIGAAVPLGPGGNGSDAGAEVFCLVEESDQKGMPAFTWLTFSCSLDQAFTVTNDRASGPGIALRAAAYEAGAAPLSQDVTVSDAALTLDARTRERTEAYLRAVEDGWEGARRKLQAAAFEVRLAELAMRPLAGARDAVSDSWNQFLKRGLEVDVVAAKFKLEALGNWAASEPKRKELLLQHEQGLTDVAAAIQKRRAEYDQILPRIEARNKELITECGHLDQKLKEVREEEAKLTQTLKKLVDASTGLQRQITALEQRINAADQETKRHTALRGQLANCALREEEVQRGLTQSQDELSQALQSFRQRLENAQSLERHLASEYTAREEMARAKDGFFQSLLRKLFGGGNRSARRRR